MNETDGRGETERALFTDRLNNEQTYTATRQTSDAYREARNMEDVDEEEEEKGRRGGGRKAGEGRGRGETREIIKQT